MYSVSDLMYIHNKIGIPIVFDYHHHQFCTGDLSEEAALKLAATTWPNGITQEVVSSVSLNSSISFAVNSVFGTDTNRLSVNYFGVNPFVDLFVIIFICFI